MASPAVELVEPLVADAGHEGDGVGLHARRHDPGHHGDGEHAGSDGQGRRAVSDRFVVERPRKEGVEGHEDEGAEGDHHGTDRGKDEDMLPPAQVGHGPIEQPTDGGDSLVERSDGREGRLGLGRLRNISGSGKEAGRGLGRVEGLHLVVRRRRGRHRRQLLVLVPRRPHLVPPIVEEARDGREDQKDDAEVRPAQRILAGLLPRILLAGRDQTRGAGLVDGDEDSLRQRQWLCDLVGREV